MKRPHLTDDIKPVTEFRAHAASLIEQVQRTKRALVLTQRGHSAVVVIAVGEYERLLAELELLRVLYTAEGQLAAGEGVPHTEARRRYVAGYVAEPESDHDIAMATTTAGAYLDAEDWD